MLASLIKKILVLIAVYPTLLFADTVEKQNTLPTMSGMLAQMVFVLLLVVGLLLGLAWMLRRAGLVQGAANGQMKVLGALSVGARERVVLVQVGQEQLVLGVTAAEISLLHLLAEPIDVSATADGQSLITASFSQRLQQALKRRQQESAS